MVPDKNASKYGQDADENLGEILGFLARECGWSCDYVADNFTIQQIKAYYEIINKQKIRDKQIDTLCMSYASAAAFGTIKSNQFKNFMDKLEMKNIPADDTIEEMKKAGLPIEDK